MKLLHIQGLRAVAIVSVVLFHFFTNFFPNGYLGVDLFFVLSGYLMSMILSKNDSLRICDIGEFLFRRIRRICPLYYLMSLAIIVSLKWSPPISWDANQKSALKSLTFTTNIFRPDNSEGYFEKLGLAVDMFTHTWSLAVEVQFYLIFPFIHVFHKQFPESMKYYFVLITAFSSLLLHFWSEQFFSFNNVLARIWQFLAGMAVFNAKEGEKETSENSSFVTTGTFVSLVLVLLWNKPIESHISRVIVVILTSLLIHLGHGFWLLENWIFESVGDVSYCWYLIHWPVVAHLKLSNVTDPVAITGYLLRTWALSVVIHYAYEKYYLTWSKITILLLVSVLLLANVVVLQNMEVDVPMPPQRVTSPTARFGKRLRMTEVKADLYFLPSDNYNFGWMGYENMTNEEKVKFQRAFDAADYSQRTLYYKYSVKDKEIPILYHFEEVSNATNMTLMVIGNSIAQNLIGLFQEECMNMFKSLHMAAREGCEPLVRTSLDPKVFNCTVNDQFVSAVQRVKPDVLFLIYRYFDTWTISNGQNPFNDMNFKIAVSRLKDYEKIVKKRIYLVDPWPQVDSTVTAQLNEYLSKGTPINESRFFDQYSEKVTIGKQRMVRLATGCKKCIIFDLASMFYINGRFTIYDPIHFVSFVNTCLHFSPPGRERIRPLIRDLCQRA